MTENEILYVTAAVEGGRSIPQTLNTIQEINEINHIAAIKGGFLVPKKNNFKSKNYVKRNNYIVRE